MEYIYNMPFVVKVISSLFVILAVNKYLKQLAVSVVAGTLFLALCTGRSPADIALISADKIFSLNILFFISIIVQVIWLSIQMSESGVMKDLVGSVRSMVSQRASMAILPAVIGLLPMPGGAIFSAPLVDDCDTDRTIDPLLKTKINYWFRHVWEYWWPLYPGVLLAIDISGLSIVQFMMLQLPLSFVSVFAGYIFLLRKLDKPERNKRSRSGIKDLLKLLLPIIVIIGVYSLIKIFIPFMSSANKYLPMITGIFIAQLVLQYQRPLYSVSWKKIITSRNTYKLTLLVVLILVYGAFIQYPLSDGSVIMTHMRTELESWGIPVFFMIMLIPFISGMTTGVAVGFVGASFPIVMSLIGPDPGMGELLSTVVLAYGSGYVGMILSPVHVCLIVSNEHFNTRLSDSILRMIKPCLVVLSGSLVMHFIIAGLW